jgi:hypothetical protein
VAPDFFIPRRSALDRADAVIGIRQSETVPSFHCRIETIALFKIFQCNFDLHGQIKWISQQVLVNS